MKESVVNGAIFSRQHHSVVQVQGAPFTWIIVSDVPWICAIWQPGFLLNYPCFEWLWYAWEFWEDSAIRAELVLVPLLPCASFHSPLLSSLHGIVVSLCVSPLDSSRVGKNKWWCRGRPFVFHYEDTDCMEEWGEEVRFSQVAIVWKHKAESMCLCWMITFWPSKPRRIQGFFIRDGGITQREMKSTSQFHELSLMKTDT